MCSNPNAKVLSSICGFSRMGPNRELKTRVETFWKEQAKLRTDGATEGELTVSIDQFERDIEQLQIQRWQQLQATGIDLIPSGDFSLYDHVLDCACLFNAIPTRYKSAAQLSGVPSHLRLYFAMARGLQEKGADVPALPMKKWFDTNYHFIVPELSTDQSFSVGLNKPLNDFLLAKNALNLVTKPVLVGPVTFLHLSRVGERKELATEEQQKVHNLKLLPSLLSHYVKVVQSLVDAGAKWIQIDEPIFALTFAENEAPAYYDAFRQTARALQQVTAKKAHLLFATYFNSIAKNVQIVKDLPEGTGIHIDLVRAPEQLDPVLSALPANCFVSLGLVDGRNVWLSPLRQCHANALRVVQKLAPGRVLVSSSCSLLHVPYSTKTEKRSAEVPKTVATGMASSKIIHWLSFGIEKCEQLVTVAKMINGGDCAKELAENDALLKDHSVSPLIHNGTVKERVTAIEASGVESYFRKSPYEQRIVQQKACLQLPPLPTTTIGSFPQSATVRAMRAKFKAHKMADADYWAFINAETERCIRMQEDIGLDVLVHGEFERNDMVEYFAEHLHGFCVTSNGWVQSYGSRCVKPPVLYGDVQRAGPMTVAMTKFAQSLTKKPVKGMLTGPMTILKWSFVRNDQPQKDTLFQVALALRDDVAELEKEGINCIQMDEPAFREGLPLDPAQHNEYLKITVQAFKISTGCVADSTQIYSHMCYSDFGDIFTHIAELDADVLCIECSRSDLSLLSCFDRFGYPLMVGPGIYDIHSPRVPSVDELKARLHAMLKYIPAGRLFANPDCGLKTRDWPETEAALRAMVGAVRSVRAELK
ncbi:hypothetical protein niasHS_005809 [Heterodera schachtii]|uniref:5-methyltetrahydropteroyltriglutamate--homocysteine S-methyltransferase n=1 Tax=Heterodera schachtii TaxID=97005 RepID=A0ABD2JZH8_HETSC